MIFLQVCSEEILSEIQDRYLKYNAHAASYTWKYEGRNLDMNKTLEENGVPDESEEFYKLSMNDEQFLPALHLYFNDDLTEAQTEKQKRIMQFCGGQIFLDRVFEQGSMFCCVATSLLSW